MNASAAAPHLTNSEFTGRKLLVFSAAVGLTTSMNAVMIYAMGPFIGPLQAEFGWDRGSISLAITILTVGVFLFGPLVGTLSDRFSAAVVGSVSLVCYALGIIAMTLLVETLTDLWIAFFIIALLGAGSTPIVLVRPISATFDRKRGLALGIVLTGAALTGFWVPNVVALVSAEYGWRAAYHVLAATALLAAPLVFFGYRHSARREAAIATGPAVHAGLTRSEAMRTRTFWMLAAMSMVMAMGIGGLLVHLVPLFQDLGATATSAAQIASIIGIASVFGRFGVGLCLDRFPAPFVCFTVFAMGIAGIALLFVGGMAFAIGTVILLGLLLGAEIDLIAYLTAELFGQKAYGAIYGWLYSLFVLSYGFSPFIVGKMRDSFGSYDSAMLFGMSVLAIACMLALGLRKPVARVA